MSSMRRGSPCSACTSLYGRSPHRPIVYVKVLLSRWAPNATATPAVPRISNTPASAGPRIFRRIALPFRVDHPVALKQATTTPEWRIALTDEEGIAPLSVNGELTECEQTCVVVRKQKRCLHSPNHAADKASRWTRRIFFVPV